MLQALATPYAAFIKISNNKLLDCCRAKMACITASKFGRHPEVSCNLLVEKNEKH